MASELPLHAAFPMPKSLGGGIWVVKAWAARQSPPEEKSALGAHPRLLLARPCGSCAHPAATCIFAGAENFMGNVHETFEYACPACGAFTTYSLWS